MKAIRVNQTGAPEVMQIEEIELPAPKAGEVRIRMEAAGVNPVDTYIREGRQGYGVTPPYTPGFDGAGVVESVGAGVTKVQSGDRVYCAGSLTGTYAQAAICREDQVYPLPDRASFAQGACMYIPYATAYFALMRGQAKPGETVLIHGASGGVGTAAVQLARGMGMRVIGTASSAEGQKTVQEEGAHWVVNHHDENHLQQAVEWNQGQGLDVILEMLANVNLAKNLSSLASRGRVVVIGSRGDIEISPRDLMIRNASVIGIIILQATPEEQREIHAYLIAGLENGSLRPVVGAEMPLTDAPKAHHQIMETQAKGNIILNPQSI